MFAFIQPALCEPGEHFSFRFSGFRQSCKRAEASKPFLCGISDSQTTTMEVTLTPVKPSPGDEEAYEGNSEEKGIFIGGSDQYVVKMNMRKMVTPVGSAGKVVTYVTTLEITNLSTATIYTTRLQSQDRVKLENPLILSADRYAPSERYFTENIFQGVFN
jgi:hypothetical protein